MALALASSSSRTARLSWASRRAAVCASSSVCARDSAAVCSSRVVCWVARRMVCSSRVACLASSSACLVSSMVKYWCRLMDRISTNTSSSAAIMSE